ncbi:Splicing factor 3b [Pyrenophora tritici-repentis]|uniref:Splicing factor 3b n=1 Tax=Pyrenophora tritici-repentis (strain Pt-1C-BFP) TaxID=426418 RepID=B2W236_PYRTR|nr:splicing factor 3b [Pyrenophora tritici-repentis Pt-1C-BFP]EDU46322.1 splicing factor 3b [Pyrenophora tritici-repentis Pt-1C-BFP]KAI1670641.1 Splicing factor 3b [Pyrenophora tritici-repentis]
MSGATAKGKKQANKNAYRRAKKKQQRIETKSDVGGSARENDSPAPAKDASSDALAVQPVNLTSIDDIANVYDLDDPALEEFKSVFEKFREPTEEEAATRDEEKAEVYVAEDGIPSDEEEEEDGQPKLSKKKMKQMNKLSVAQLKSMVSRPELVEWTDVSSSDPKLLISIKGAKNVIPVPTHWSLKREYLSSKRGIEKPPFALPKFIQETGIAEMRDAVLEKQAEMTMRQKQRERVQGKLGKLDIDYAKLYDAFFRRQTKPELTRYGEVYYEGKEFETNLVNLKPGELSEELREALGMTPGQPPPWLINMQRFGPPPSYPNMRVPGVNAPIPPGSSWGFQPGQWGKPPTDDGGKPLFGGDLYGTAILEEQQQPTHTGEPVERGIWGALRAEGESEDEESDEEEEEEDEDEEGGDVDPSGIQTSMTTASAMPSEIGGAESIAGEFQLRKQRKGIETEEPGAPRSAYTVLPEKNISATGFFGGEHAYDLDAARRDTLGHSQRKRKAGDVDISVDVDQLADSDKLDKDALKKEYESRQRAEAQGQWQSIDQDDLADMINQESRKRAKREGR